MDRRQRKTREAIFSAFTRLVAQKRLSQITVGNIIEEADVGRATFYAHFETKDALLQELCRELFCHVFDAMEGHHDHSHIFSCDAPSSVFLHLFRHLQKNDNQILALLTCQDNQLFLQYFKEELVKLVSSQTELLSAGKKRGLPEDFYREFVASTFVETVRYWLSHQKRQSPEEMTDCFLLAVNG